MTEQPPTLEISDLRLALRHPPHTELVRGVDLTVAPGEKVALVGESGSGKSVLSLATMGLLPPAIGISSGELRVTGTSVVNVREEELDRLRGAAMAMIYQDPMSSLNPVRTVGRQIAEVIRTHRDVSAAQARRRAIDLLGAVGVRDPQRTVDNYPHEFSGGMRQRVMIAMAIACEPALLLADEPTTALDVTTQARIVELLASLVAEHGMSIVFITHDIALAASFCDRVEVMQSGTIIESGPTDAVTGSPQHEYTQKLVGSICTFDMDPDMPLLAGSAGSPGGA